MDLENKEQYNSLGRDANKEFRCEYKGHETDCALDCSKCAIRIRESAEVALSRNDIKEAITLCKKAVFIEPHYADAWLLLGKVYARQNEYTRALDSFEKTLAIDPRYGEAGLEKAIVLRALGRLDEAMEVVEKILRVYNSPKVYALKKELLDSGLRNPDLMTQQEAMKAIRFAAGKKINDFLRKYGKGQAPIKVVVDQGKEFTEKALDYCKKIYSSLNEDAFRAKCLLISFYGVIAVIDLYYHDRNRFKNGPFNGGSAFDYLYEHVNLEAIDEHAERILNTKSGEEVADELWNILSFYIDEVKESFQRTESPYNAEEMLLMAMEYAYILGNKYGRYFYRQQHRSNLDVALESLAATAKEEEEKEKASKRVIMCYAIGETITPTKVPLYFTCDKCGKETNIIVNKIEKDLFDKKQGDEQLIIEKYRQVAEEFSQSGYPATIICCCDECLSKYFPTADQGDNIVFSVLSPLSQKIVYSYPTPWEFDSFRYRAALGFLQGADTIEKLREKKRLGTDSSTYYNIIKNILIGAGNNE